jgi:hypothetical protein
MVERCHRIRIGGVTSRDTSIRTSERRNRISNLDGSGSCM